MTKTESTDWNQAQIQPPPFHRETHLVTLTPHAHPDAPVYAMLTEQVLFSLRHTESDTRLEIPARTGYGLNRLRSRATDVLSAIGPAAFEPFVITHVDDLTAHLNGKTVDVPQPTLPDKIYEHLGLTHGEKSGDLYVGSHGIPEPFGEWTIVIEGDDPNARSSREEFIQLFNASYPDITLQPLPFTDYVQAVSQTLDIT